MGIIYRMFSWGDDPGEWGAYGFERWERLHTGPGEYNWSIIDQWLDKQMGLGRETVFAVATHLSSMTGWDEVFYDATPRFIYDLYDSGRPVMGGRRVGHIVEWTDKEADPPVTYRSAIPAYEDKTGPWWRYLREFVLAFGARYDGDARLGAVHLAPGLDMETQGSKAPFGDGNTGYRFGQLCVEYPRWYREAFPTKPLFYACAPGQGRMGLAQLCKEIGIGVKHNGGFLQDLASWDGYGAFVGLWDHMQWAMENGVQTWVESAYGYLSDRNRYWAKFSALHYHPVGVDMHSGLMDKLTAEDRAFICDHVGVTAASSPGYWCVLRDSLYEKDEWTQEGQPAGCSGHVGNWEFYMKMDMANSDAVRVENVGPGAAFESRQSRLVKEGYFDIDQGAREGPYDLSIRALAGPGRGSLRVEWLDGVTIVAKVLSLEAEADAWTMVTATIEGRAFGLMSDNGAYVHMVYAKPVEGGEPPEPPEPPTNWAAILAKVDEAVAKADQARQQAEYAEASAHNVSIDAAQAEREASAARVNAQEATMTLTALRGMIEGEQAGDVSEEVEAGW